MPDGPAPAPRVPAPAANQPTAGAEFARLVEIMRILRSAHGCPWDREQNWQSLSPYVLEEAYEVVDAIDRNHAGELKEEIGDMIFEGVFLAQVAADDRQFTIRDALQSVCEKLIRRHPHVFAQPDASAGTDGEGVDTPRAVLEQWEQIKERERAAAGQTRQSALDGLPAALPALSQAHRLGSKAAGTGFDWPDAPAVLDKVEEEISELRAVVPGDARRVEEELGDLLFALTQFARKAGLRAEDALRHANQKFARRFRAMENEVAGQGQQLSERSLDDLEAIWQQIKRRE